MYVLSGFFIGIYRFNLFSLYFLYLFLKYFCSLNIVIEYVFFEGEQNKEVLLVMLLESNGFI